MVRAPKSTKNPEPTAENTSFPLLSAHAPGPALIPHASKNIRQEAKFGVKKVYYRQIKGNGMPMSQEGKATRFGAYIWAGFLAENF